MATAKTLDEMISENMTTDEIFQAWGILQDYASYILTSVQARLEGIDIDDDSKPTQEQQDLLELQETLESMRLM